MTLQGYYNRAQYMKDHKIERTQGRCPVCYRIVHADYLDRGMAGHVCERRDKK